MLQVLARVYSLPYLTRRIHCRLKFYNKLVNTRPMCAAGYKLRDAHGTKTYRSLQKRLNRLPGRRREGVGGVGGEVGGAGG